jgi:hypothetical protein
MPQKTRKEELGALLEATQRSRAELQEAWLNLENLEAAIQVAQETEKAINQRRQREKQKSPLQAESQAIPPGREATLPIEK